MLCRKYKVTLGCRKAQALTRTVTFFGMRCSPEGTTLTEKNTAARALPGVHCCSEGHAAPDHGA